MKHLEKQWWLELKQKKEQFKCAHQYVCELRHEVLEDLEESDRELNFGKWVKTSSSQICWRACWSSQAHNIQKPFPIHVPYLEVWSD